MLSFCHTHHWSNQMTIRQRIRLTGIMSATTIALMLVWILLGQLAEWNNKRATQAAIGSFAAWMRLVHHLQHERGTTAGLSTDPAATLRYVARVAASDSSLLRIPQPEQLIALNIRESLTNLRTGILSRSIQPGEALEKYSHLIHDIQIHLATYMHQLAYNHDFSALSRLGFVKEQCGQVRATVYAALLDPESFPGPIEPGRNAILTAPHFITSLTNGVSPEVVRLLSPGDLFQSIKEYFLRASSLMRQRHPSSPLRAAGWFEEASTFIDQLHQLENGILSAIADTVHSEIRYRQVIIIGVTLIALALAAGLISLTITTFRKILASLDTLKTALSNAAQSGNLDMLIQTPPPSNEFGLIHEGIKELVGSVRSILDENETRATTDILTGLANRLRFNEALDLEIARRKRHPGKLSLIICDIDHFKTVNDTFGHPVGDKVLQAFARILRFGIRRTDMAARWGGEEFAILAVDTDSRDAVALAEKLRQTIAVNAFPSAGRISASFGVAELLPEDTAQSLVIRTDRALYRAKSGGRNRVCREG